MTVMVEPQDRARANGSVKEPLTLEKTTFGANPVPLLSLGLSGVGLRKQPQTVGSPRTRP